jgi:hypothetical protein
MLYFFRSLIDFDWIEDHLISGRVSLTFLINRIGSSSDLNGSDGFLGSGRILPPLSLTAGVCQVKEIEHRNMEYEL